MMMCISSRTTLTFLLLLATVQAQTCRSGKDKTPHQAALWQDEFPNQNDFEALCEGTIEVKGSGDICITGRVSYKQLAKHVGTPIRGPAADSISISGHLVSGSGNVVLGYEANFLYDFVKSYTIGGVEVTAGTETANALIAASNGLIEGFCLDKSFTREEELYAISHDIWTPNGADADKLVDANIIYASCYAITAEYHRPSTNGPWFGTITNALITFAAGLTPPVVFKYLPLLGGAGIFRYFVVGTVSTGQVPQPLTAPGNTMVENVQIDTEWSTLIGAMNDGLFRGDDKVPLYFNVLIKKIEPLTDKSCWAVTAAAIDIQAPQGQGDKLDEFVNEHVIPALEARTANIGLHMGKRLESGSTLLSTAWSTYNRQCGVTLNTAPDPCYHPACTRSGITTNFIYSPTFFQAGKEDSKDHHDSYDGSSY